MLRFLLRRGKPLVSASKPKASSTIIYSTVNQPSKLGTSLSKYGVNLSKYAADGKLDPGWLHWQRTWTNLRRLFIKIVTFSDCNYVSNRERWRDRESNSGFVKENKEQSMFNWGARGTWEHWKLRRISWASSSHTSITILLSQRGVIFEISIITIAAVTVAISHRFESFLLDRWGKLQLQKDWRLEYSMEMYQNQWKTKWS